MDRERRALAHFGLHVDASLVVLDDFLADRQPQAGTLRLALARGALRREEGLEDFRLKLFGDPRAGVDDLKLQLRAVIGPLRLDRERPAATQHRLAGVDQ